MTLGMGVEKLIIITLYFLAIKIRRDYKVVLHNSLSRLKTKVNYK